MQRDAAFVVPRRVLVVAAPPTPNGDLHVGHLAGPYLAGDILTRYLRLRGEEVHYVSGTDDNQSYVESKALQMGIAPQEVADLMAGKIAATLAAARIEVERFIRPNASPYYRSVVSEFFRRLSDRGELTARQAPVPYCEVCQKYLHEDSVLGRCPRCGCPADGSGCVSCGYANNGAVLEARCAHCNHSSMQRICPRLYFPLGRYADALRAYWAGCFMGPGLRSLCEQALEAGLPDIAVTQMGDWGIPVPVEGFEGQRILTWCEEVAFCLTYPQSMGFKWESYWKSDQASVVQCFGFDNAFYQTVLAPALLLAFDPEIRPPSVFLMNEFYLLDGEKFSTSRGHVIWGRDLLADVPADALRFHLAATYPEQERTNFRRDEFARTVDDELFGMWQSWLIELAARMRSGFEDRVPGAGEWDDEQRSFRARLEALTAEAAEAYDAWTFSPQRAARILGELVREARNFALGQSGRGAAARRTAMALELLAAKQLAVLSSPLLPDFAGRLWSALGYGMPLGEHRWEEQPSWVPVGARLCGLAAAARFRSVRTGPGDESTPR